jgi:hypothetical protein
MEMRVWLRSFMEWSFIIGVCENNIKMDVREAGLR